MTHPAGNPDADDLRRFLAGDRRAFEGIVARNQNRVYAVCLRMLRDPDAAFDATQDAFVQALRTAPRFEGRALFSTWLYRVAINTCHDRLRRDRRRPTVSLDGAPGDGDPPREFADPAAERAVESAAMRPDLQSALDALGPDFRATVVLCDIEGLDYAEAAAVLNVAVGTIKSRLSRARAELARRLRPGNGTRGREATPGGNTGGGS